MDEHPPGHIPEPADPGDEPADTAAVATGLTRAFRPWVVGAVVVLGFVGLLLWGANRPDDPEQASTPAAETASTPADGLDFAEIARRVGEGCLRLLEADSAEERQSGLRYRESELERVDGMLFAYSQPTGGAFTMSEVVEPLEIGFYGADGARLGEQLVMEPCEGSIVECPLHPAPGGFQYAIETAPGHLPEGDLGGECEP